MRMLCLLFSMILFSIPQEHPKPSNIEDCAHVIKVEPNSITVTLYCLDKRELATFIKLAEQGAKLDSVIDQVDLTIVLTSKKNLHQ